MMRVINKPGNANKKKAGAAAEDGEANDRKPAQQWASGLIGREIRLSIWHKIKQDLSKVSVLAPASFIWIWIESVTTPQSSAPFFLSVFETMLLKRLRVMPSILVQAEGKQNWAQGNTSYQSHRYGRLYHSWSQQKRRTFCNDVMGTTM